MGVTQDQLVERYPTLFHMAEAGSWPSIQKHGLLSTSALLDLFEVGGELRAQLESAHRPESVTISHKSHGSAVIRDQKPMDDRGLQKALLDGITPTEWYRTLNSKVFFWVTEKRLNTLLGARAYRNKRHTVLTVNTSTLLSAHASRVLLCPMNSGCTKPNPHPRGRNAFLPMSAYPFEERRKKASRDAVVELAVPGGVHDIVQHVQRVEEVGGGQPSSLLWPNAGGTVQARMPAASLNDGT
jgi:hypothetical protein